MKKYWCKCFDDEDSAAFDTQCLALVNIKIDENENDITHEYSDWDYHTDTLDGEPQGDVTCGCCGRVVEAYDN